MPELPRLLTFDQLAEICHGTPPRRVEPFLSPLNHYLHVYEINTPPRVAAFLAQICHESGNLRWTREIWGPTPQQARYEPPSPLARRLGNTETGDGHTFMGRGLIQVTGRYNYAQVAVALAQDFVANPALLEQPLWATASACWFWSTRGLNPMADEGTEDAYRRITRRINGGLNGWADRLEKWHRIQSILDIESRPRVAKK